MRTMMRANEVAHRLGISIKDLQRMHSKFSAPPAMDVGGATRFYRRRVVDAWAKSRGRATPNDWREIDV